MPHLDNDMDDTFREAAEHYPLKTGKGDWESLLKKMAATASPAGAGSPREGRTGKWMLILGALLLFVAGGVTVAVLLPGRMPGKTIPAPAARNMQTAEPGTVIKGAHRPPGSTAPALKQATPELTGSGVSPSAANHVAGSGREIMASRFYISSGSQAVVPYPGRSLAMNRRAYTGEGEWQQWVRWIEPPADAGSKQRATLTVSHRNLANPVRQRGIYMGLTAGPDFSRVATGPFGSAGYHAGILAGYRFGRRLSLETGIMAGRKYYQSDGRYFNMDRVRNSMPGGMVIHHLQGRSSLLEIPVQARIDLAGRRSGDFFVTAGIAVYAVTGERNRYDATLNGTPEKMTGTYGNTPGFPTAVAFGAGYEHRFLSSYKIRFEPYYRIPLRGMGVGSLPVTSAGVRIGFTRFLR